MGKNTVTEDDTGIKYQNVDVNAIFTVLTVIPYSDKPQYREYYVDSDELPMLIQSFEDDQTAEMVIDVSKSIDMGKEK